jgi:site-specific recombinase XerD
MTNEITLSEPAHELGPVLQKAEEYVRQSKSANTRMAYANDWDQFQKWCLVHRVASLPASPETVALYIADMAESSRPSTIKRHLASISVAHQAKGLKSPNSLLVQATMAGIRRVKGATKDKKSPVRVGHLIHLSDVLPKNLQGIRDKAIFLIGYAGAFRRSELVNLDVEDVHFESEGVRITVRHSKTDQESIGQTKDINYAVHSVNCPVKALKKWVEQGSIETGPLFRPVNRHGNILPQRLTPQSIALVVKRVMQALRMDPDQFSGHSLRAGFVTDCIKSGVQSQVIRRVTGHRSESTLSDYFREADTFDYNIIAKLGL